MNDLVSHISYSHEPFGPGFRQVRPIGLWWDHRLGTCRFCLWDLCRILLRRSAAEDTLDNGKHTPVFSSWTF